MERNEEKSSIATQQQRTRGKKCDSFQIICVAMTCEKKIESSIKSVIIVILRYHDNQCFRFFSIGLILD